MTNDVAAGVFASADRAELAIVRAMWSTDTVDVLDRLSVLVELRRRMDARIEREVAVALEVGESCGRVGARLGISRQAVHRRFVASKPHEAAEAANTADTSR